MSANNKIKNLKEVRVSYNLRTPNDTKKDSAVKCVIRWNNNTLTLHSVAKINPNHFDRKKKRAKNNGKSTAWDSGSFNQRLEELEGKIKKLFREYLNNHNEYPSFDNFKAIISDKLSSKKKQSAESLIAYTESYIEKSKTRFNEKTKRLLTPAIIKSYNRTLGILIEYKSYIKKRDITFSDATLKFYEGLTEYMQNNLNFAINTIGTHFRNLKTILRSATEEGVNKNLDYTKRRFKSHRVDVDNIFLNIEELNKIQNLDLTTQPSLENARDLFLVGCWTGLRFSDFTKLTTDNFNIQDNTIHILTQKTQKPVVIPLLPPLQMILNKYNGFTENSLPKSISNQKLNDYIKAVGKKAGLSELINIKTIKGGKEITYQSPKHDLITTHTARRSFASNLYIKGVPTISIMQITGHKTESSFLKYIKLEPKNHANIVADFFK
ncbi:site-specific integrase [Sphingobacterium luzhongxinii]|uniref:site-specific integrase n=1 Tax=Sphingobacterium luzhongxinii TaxID=2654181 RepID=UPI0013DA5990|nr:site-specific integrase [Sphingobacterium sp. xlx-73]